ncbi:hypothetical protein PHYPSEUDO_007050 [Phytophthora pseudosyringae]|uniref:Protein kinase domain-containing protein n=1 Tax=Phytophthora pseudosyringae TaxID=221518 RepID=A0A8T1VK14_9STRA|nr:hypothetical protein PHYPSEUDO_007050 [Phytophthora pseudosyringae]
MAPISHPAKSSSGGWTSAGETAMKNPKAARDCQKWGNVKTWTFAQLLASSFAKVSLEDAMRNGGNSPAVEKKQGNDKENKPTSGNNDWDCSYSCLKAAAAAPPSAVSSSSSTVASETDTKSAGRNNDWDCSYSSLKPAASRPTISASSSSSTLLSDAEMSHLRRSIEELLEHEATVEEGSEEENPVACRDPTRYVFDIVRIIGSGSYGTVLLCRLRACPNRLFAVKVVYKSKLGSINGLDGDRNATREARRLLTEKKQVEGHLVYEEREPQGAVSDEEENNFYFGDFDWCADASHFQ